MGYWVLERWGNSCTKSRCRVVIILNIEAFQPMILKIEFFQVSNKS